MVRKAKGNIFIETIASLFILSTIGFLAFNLISSVNKYLNNEKESREIYECFHAVVNEIRYNLDEEKFTNIAEENKVEISYDKNLLDELKTKDLFDIRGTNEESVILIEYKIEDGEFVIKLEAGDKILEQKVKKNISIGN